MHFSPHRVHSPKKSTRKGALDIMFADGLFIVFAILSVLGAVGLVLFRHPMNGAMSFIVTLISLAGLYALLSAKLIFALQLIVYAGAIMSLIVFIIMFLNIQPGDLPKEETKWLYILGGTCSRYRPLACCSARLSKACLNIRAEILATISAGSNRSACCFSGIGWCRSKSSRSACWFPWSALSSCW
jgi:NADH-quinone oxidoreductase subunit J